MSTEIQQRISQTESELQAISAQIGALERSVQIAKLTQNQIKASTMPSEPVWQAVGRMFVLSSVEEYSKIVEARETQVKEQLNGLDKKQKYFEKNLDNLTKSLKETSV